VTRTVERFRKVEVLVNTAGRGMKDVSPEFLTEPTRFWETGPEVWKMLVDTGVNGPFFMARAVVPGRLEAGGGSIVNVSINYEPMKRRGFSPYGPSKAALESELIIYAQDLEGTGIRLNGLLPGGATETRMLPSGLFEEVPSRLLRPGIVAGPAIYPASDDSGHLTGHRLVSLPIGLLRAPKGPSPLTAWEPKTKDRCVFRHCCCRGALTITTAVGERSEPAQYLSS
jgi:NAD(P)-dependent dehydrogenase (short-subunit alcohol dehydrogenase family)